MIYKIILSHIMRKAEDSTNNLRRKYQEIRSRYKGDKEYFNNLTKYYMESIGIKSPTPKDYVDAANYIMSEDHLLDLNDKIVEEYRKIYENLKIDKSEFDKAVRNKMEEKEISLGKASLLDFLNTAKEIKQTNSPEDVDKIRKEYAKIMSHFCRELCNKQEFTEKVKEFLNKKGKTNPTPQDYVDAAKKVSFRCDRCSGTGQFITHVENGVLKGNGEVCFRCSGKGSQNYEDVKRNYGHDQNIKFY